MLMPKYRWVIEFEADHDRDAKGIVYGHYDEGRKITEGVADMFGDIYDDKLTRENGSRVD